MTLKRSGRSEHYLNGCKLQRLYDQTMSQIKMKCFQVNSFPCMPCLHFLSGTIQSQNFHKKLITYINHFIESLINYNFTIYKLYSALVLVSSTIFTNKLSNRKQPPVGLTPLTRLRRSRERPLVRRHGLVFTLPLSRTCQFLRVSTMWQ